MFGYKMNFPIKYKMTLIINKTWNVNYPPSQKSKKKITKIEYIPLLLTFPSSDAKTKNSKIRNQ